MEVSGTEEEVGELLHEEGDGKDRSGEGSMSQMSEFVSPVKKPSINAKLNGISLVILHFNLKHENY